MNMIQIAERTRRARKKYVCDLCCDYIDVNENYIYQFNKDGKSVYNFRCHCKCYDLSNKLWEFILPWDGMSSDEFLDGVSRFCKRFICPRCPSWSSAVDECEEDNSYCIDKCMDMLKNKTIDWIPDDAHPGFGHWILQTEK